MISSPEHARWLRSGAAQRRSSEGVAAFLARWGSAPLLSEFRREVEGPAAPSAPALIEAARRAFDRTEEINALVGDMVEACRSDPFFSPPYHALTSDIHSGLLLYEHPLVSLSIGVIGVDALAAKKTRRSGSASVVFTGLWNVFRCVEAGEALVSFWEAPPIEDGFTAQSAGSCRCVGRRQLADGDEIIVDGSRQSFVIEHAARDTLYLQATIRSASAPLTIEYDSDHGRFVGASSTDEASSRVQMMASLLRQMEREDAVPVLREFLGHRHFYTRWHIMRELLATDAEAALPDLRRMAAADPHAEVRIAARQALDMFFDEEDALCLA